MKIILFNNLNKFKFITTKTTQMLDHLLNFELDVDSHNILIGKKSWN